MIDKNEANRILKVVLSASKSEMTEAVLESDRLSLTRFSERRISDHIDREETTLYVRCTKDKKIGVIATGDISTDGIKKAVDRCQAALEYMIPDENFVSFPGPDEARLPEDLRSQGTSDFGPRDRAEAIRKIAAIAHKGNLDASGAYRQEEKAVAVANSLGISRFYTGNQAQLSMTLAGQSGNSGWSIAYHPDAVQIDVDALALTASRKAMMSLNPQVVPDGQYTVILEPAAVGQLLILLSFMGFGCKTFYQRRSFMAGHLGEKIAGDNFTVYEDPFDKAFTAPPFDYEGTPKQKVSLIENGIARGVVYNSYYANLMNAASTGHALAPTNTFGPYPKHLVIPGGDTGLEDVIKSTENGILITHFWYLNYLNPMRTMVTGTTRDGTFLVENGRISSPIKTMRTNQSILEAFSNIEAVSKEQAVYPQYGVLMKIPALRIANFNLTAEQEENGKC
ncbi:MAG: TldD/PmbA family protein [Candidatus Zixiibacteriota bacterium]|nr:MAG: TldD/PmbA family protein [candidate division Zixibacteria bacterium]